MTTITIHTTDTDRLRGILRDQIGADAELLSEIDDGLATVQDRAGIEARISLCESMAAQIGGLMTDDMLSEWLTDGSERV